MVEEKKEGEKETLAFYLKQYEYIRTNYKELSKTTGILNPFGREVYENETWFSDIVNNKRICGITFGPSPDRLTKLIQNQGYSDQLEIIPIDIISSRSKKYFVCKKENIDIVEKRANLYKYIRELQNQHEEEYLKELKVPKDYKAYLSQVVLGLILGYSQQDVACFCKNMEDKANK